MLRQTLILPVLLLLSPAVAWSADSCDAVGKELDNIAAQISDIVRPCEVVTDCSKEKWEEVGAQIKSLVDRAEKLRQECFGGAPSEAPVKGLPPGNGGAE